MTIDREQVTRELLELLEQMERREATLKERTKAEREAIAELRAQAKERRDILGGRRGVQLGLGQVHETLEAAAGVARRKGGRP